MQPRNVLGEDTRSAGEEWFSTEDVDAKRKKEAELLVKTDLPPEYICGYVVYDEATKNKLIHLGINDNMIVVKPDYYF